MSKILSFIAGVLYDINKWIDDLPTWAKIILVILCVWLSIILER